MSKIHNVVLLLFFQATLKSDEDFCSSIPDVNDQTFLMIQHP